MHNCENDRPSDFSVSEALIAGAASPRASSLRGLLALNAALLGGLALVALAPSVSAQAGRVRGEYAMVAGTANGSNKVGVVYIADVVNQELIAVLYAPDEKVLKGVAARNLRVDAADLLAGRVKTGQDSQKGGSTR